MVKNSFSPQMNADERRLIRKEILFICVHLRSSAFICGKILPSPSLTEARMDYPVCL